MFVYLSSLPKHLITILDSIEANVEQGAHRVEDGNKQLVKAIKHQVTNFPQIS